MRSGPIFPCGPILNGTVIRARPPTNMGSDCSFSKRDVPNIHENGRMAQSNWSSCLSSIYNAPSEYPCSYRGAPHFPEGPILRRRRDYRWNIASESSTNDPMGIGLPMGRDGVCFIPYTGTPRSPSMEGDAQSQQAEKAKGEESKQYMRMRDGSMNTSRKSCDDTNAGRPTTWTHGASGKRSGLPPPARMVRPRNAVVEHHSNWLANRSAGNTRTNDIFPPVIPRPDDNAPQSTAMIPY